MKKSILFMACCIGLMFFASCKKGGPTITVVTDPGYACQNSEVFSGDPILVGFNVTGENLVQMTMIAEQNGAAIYNDTETLDNVSSYSYTKYFTLDVTGAVTIRGTVTDASGRTATKSFDLNFNEKPNAKFIGHYEGDILYTGTGNLNVSGQEPQNLEFNEEPFASVVDIEPGESIIEVIATISIDQQSSTVKGTVEGNKVTFEAINDTFYQSYQGVVVPIEMTYAITGVLNGDQLEISGTCSGHGEVNIVIISGTIDLDGTLGGSLTKTN